MTQRRTHSRTSAKGPAPGTDVHAPEHAAAAETGPATNGLEAHDHVPVVGIGASAGGLEAFSRVLGELTDSTGLAYVLVQHLDPAHRSLLPEILERAARIPVVAAADGMRIEANRVYVIPPGAAMTLVDGHLKVLQRERARGVHTLIDEFLVSLSEVLGSNAVGVILSGAGSDGARGIEAIKERGGITMAQEPGSAQFQSMPENAIETGAVDLVLAPEDIAGHLVQFGRLVAAGRADETSDAGLRADADKILVLVLRRTGIDFRQYRSGTVERRIVRRMLARGKDRHEEYLRHLRVDPEELDVLCKDILIGVTRFFRDPEAFTALQNVAFQEITKGRSPGTPIRIWVAGCSGGEETYSVAILALEYLTEAGLDFNLQIFATDLNESAVARARAGVYPHSIEQDVSPERLARFFVREDRGYRISRRIRDMCVFARHNLVQDPPFSQLDLITCRNVLIYFDAPLQERAMEVFHYGLRENGVLMLGNAESADPAHFTPLDKRHKLYRPQPRSRRSTGLATSVAVHPVHSIARLGPVAVSRSTPHAIQQDADRAVLTRFAPPGVVIDSSLEIVQFRGDTSGFLQHSSGVASLDLLKLVRPELLAELRSAIEQASVDAKAVRTDEIPIREGDSLQRIALEVIPFRSGGAGERFFAILFGSDTSEVLRLAPSDVARRASEQPSRPARPATDLDAAWEIARLNEELADAKRYLQEVGEQYDAANEELRSASEEIQSSNEELRSTNEELETTKEEVQSTNEELTTVNEELRHRNRELAAVASDLANVVANTQLPIVIVDSTLVVRRFTPITDRVLKIIGSDAGRPLGDVKTRFDLPDLEARTAATIATLEVSQVDVRDDQGRWWTLTIRPYLSIDRKVDGAVLVFTDIDATKRFGVEATEMAEARRLLLLDAEAARTEATAANMAKLAFLAHMSHDLRTPLNAIAGYADLMQLHIHGPLTGEQEVDLDRIKQSSRHLLSLINDILNYAKVESGHLDLKIVSMPVTEALDALATVAGSLVYAKHLSLELSPCEGTVLADREKLQQILLNLVTNAVKFTERGGISVACSRDESTIRFEVTDTGIGIAADQFERIFEPFIQVSRSLTNVKHEGVGLGLSISRELARAMRGDITVESAVGKGSTFVVTLLAGEA